MHTITPTAPAALTAPANHRQEIPAHVLPLMESARAFVRAQRMNPVEKNDECRSLLDTITNLPSSYAPGLEAHEKTTREGRRNEAWARYHAFNELRAEDDSTPESRAAHRARAQNKLPEWERYAFAAAEVREIENDSLGLEKPSRTGEIVAARAKEYADEMSRALGYALSAAQLALLDTITRRNLRVRRFRLERKAAWGRTLLIDAVITANRGRQDLARYVEDAATLAEIKELGAMWGQDVKVTRQEGESIVVGNGFEIQRAS